MKFKVGDQVVLSTKGKRKIDRYYIPYFKTEQTHIYHCEDNFVLVITSDSETKFVLPEDFLEKEGNMGEITNWKILPHGQICYFVGRNSGGFAVVQVADGKLTAVVDSQIKDAPKECDGFNWKPEVYNSLTVGCVTLENRNGSIVDVRNPKECLCHEDKLKSLINQLNDLVNSVDSDCNIYQIGIDEKDRGLHFVETQDIIDLCTRKDSASKKDKKAYHD